MNTKSESDTTSSEFRRRFPTNQDLIDYLLATPAGRRVSPDQLYAEQRERIKRREAENKTAQQGE